MVIPIYILIEYSSNYSGMTGSLWFNFKDEATVFDKDIANDNALVYGFILKMKQLYLVKRLRTIMLLSLSSVKRSIKES